jgi:hypothetical protein
MKAYKLLKMLVGAPGFEPGTSCAQGKRATRLRHAPKEQVSGARFQVPGSRRTVCESSSQCIALHRLHRSTALTSSLLTLDTWNPKPAFSILPSFAMSVQPESPCLIGACPLRCRIRQGDGFQLLTPSV